MLSAQTDKSEVRKGNREYRKGEFKEAEIDYRRALVKDSLSFAANYNLACDLYRQEQYDEAGNYMKKIADQAAASARESDYYYNLGDIALAKQDYKGAVDAFEKALLLNPGDMDAKENYVYAKMMLQNQQNQQNQDNQNQDNQDNQNQDQDNQNQNQDQKQNDQNQDNQDQKQNDQNQDQNNNQDQRNDQDRQNQSPQQQDAKISPQAAQQMLQAIQAREKETQDKVNREKAAAMKSRQKEKNW
ncbi:MAG: tetratricopeptide repeat protein [Candidatus Cryptobacteroides sp.]|nr:tetratricopeptide repeat protein [Rikenellaceae bacterium]MDY4562713.1 tetratricopeptide repeat protein [Candidatus Cryptobacteroides sp.]